MYLNALSVLTRCHVFCCIYILNDCRIGLEVYEGSTDASHFKFISQAFTFSDHILGTQ